MVFYFFASTISIKTTVKPDGESRNWVIPVYGGAGPVYAVAPNDNSRNIE